MAERTTKEELEMSDSTNTKTFLGMPMRWEPKHAFKNLWNPDEDRVFPPKYFGIGWDLNLHALAKRAGLVKGRRDG